MTLNAPQLTLPLMVGSLDTTIAWVDGKLIDRYQFLKIVLEVAERLPDAAYTINLCENRFKFLVTFCAAICRNQTNLLPPSRVSTVIDEIGAKFPDHHCVTDSTVRLSTDGLSAHDVDIPAIPMDHRAAIAFTSGSTGKPHPYPKLWSTLVNTVDLQFRHISKYSQPFNSVVATVPPQHMYGLESSVIAALLRGIGVWGHRPSYPEDISHALRQVTGGVALVTTPVHIRALLRSKVSVPEISLIMSATAPLDASLAHQAEQRFGCKLVEVYGCTETGALAGRWPTVSDLFQPYSGVHLRQEGGVILCSADHFDGEHVLQDIIQLHSDGSFSLLGRVQDMVNVSGKRTSLSYLNKRLLSIKQIRDGIMLQPGHIIDNEETESRYGDRLAAIVVTDAIENKDITVCLTALIDQVFLPRTIHRVDKLPRNETGKITQEVLVALWEKLTLIH